MAIKIPFVAEVRDFLSGTKDVETALGDVGDALDELGRNDSTETLERDLKDLSRQAETSAEDVEVSFSDMAASAKGDADKIDASFTEAFKNVKAQGRTSSKSVKADLDETASKGSTTLREFSSEAKQNVAESVSSFNGSASSAVDALQSTFGGLVTALGPAGVVGAAVVGVGIGLARNLFEKSQERAQEVAEAVADLAGQFIELGKTDLGAEQINDKLREFAETAEDGSIKLDELAEEAREAGISFADYARGIAGDTDAIRTSYDEVTSRLGDIREGEEALMHSRDASQTSVDAYVAAHLDEVAALEKARTALIEQDGTLDQAATTAGLYKTATEGTTEATEDAAAALAEENEKLAENARLKGNAAEAGWDMADALDAVDVSGKKGTKTLDENTKAGRDNAREVLNAVEAINEWADAQIDAGADVDKTNAKLKDQEDALVKKVAPAFGGSEKKAREYIKTLGGIPAKKETEVKVDDKGSAKHTQEQIDSIKSSGVPVPVTPDMSGVDAQIRSYFNGKVYRFTAAPRAGKNVAV